MAVASFEELCAGFCELVQVSPPPLKADAQGLVAFHVVLRGITVNFVHRPDVTPDHVFVIFELGALDHRSEHGFGQLEALLDANFALLQLNSPVFSRNPGTGDVVLQYIYPLFETTASSLYQLIEKEIDRISQWVEIGSTPGIRADSWTAPGSETLPMLHQIA